MDHATAKPNFIELAADIVSAYVSNNSFRSLTFLV
jgi:predicted transcriptional regulator